MIHPNNRQRLRKSCNNEYFVVNNIIIDDNIITK